MIHQVTDIDDAMWALMECLRDSRATESLGLVLAIETALTNGDITCRVDEYVSFLRLAFVTHHLFGENDAGRFVQSLYDFLDDSQALVRVITEAHDLIEENAPWSPKWLTVI